MWPRRSGGRSVGSPDSGGVGKKTTGCRSSTDDTGGSKQTRKPSPGAVPWRRNVLLESSPDSKRISHRPCENKTLMAQKEKTHIDDWHKRPRLSLREHIEWMRSNMHNSRQYISDSKERFGDSTDLDNDDDHKRGHNHDHDQTMIPRITTPVPNDDVVRDVTPQNSNFPSFGSSTGSVAWWETEWQSLRKSSDPVVTKTAAELADMSDLAMRLRRLRIDHGLAPAANDHRQHSAMTAAYTCAFPDYAFYTTSSSRRDPRFFQEDCPYNPLIKNARDTVDFNRSNNHKSPWMKSVYVCNTHDVILPGCGQLRVD